MNLEKEVFILKSIFRLSFLFSCSALALDAANCPSRIDMKIDVLRVHKDSIYSKNPQWKMAQRTLSQTESIESLLKLVSKNAKSCIYRDNDLGSATLTTSEFHDPEQRSPVKADQLIVTHRDGDSTYVSFVPVQSFNSQSLVLYKNPFQVKIKARLYFSENNRWASIDMGMVSVLIK